MAAVKHWNVDIDIDEHDHVTQAEARLMSGDGVALRARGTARRNPHDLDVPGIGDELAAARALSDLSRRRLHAAATDIEDVTHEHADPHP